ncbi:MAG: succinylglutamate desuccinylase/aspartoacylase family protein, partial [Ketobacter sp.]
GPHSLDQESVSHGVKGIKNLLHNLEMYKTVRLWLIPQPVFYQSTWVRSSSGGIMLSKVELDEKVKKGQLLGKVVDPITNTSSDIISPLDGIVLGKALDQVVSPGFATFHIGIIATEEQLAEPIPAAVTEPELEGENGDSMTSPPIAPTETSEPFQDMDS